MSRESYNPAHGFQKTRSFVQRLWVSRLGQGHPCLTGGPKMISCIFGTDSFKNGDTVAKTIFDETAKRTRERPEWIGKTQITSKVVILNFTLLYHFTPQLEVPNSQEGS